MYLQTVACQGPCSTQSPGASGVQEMPAPNWGSLFGLHQNNQEKIKKGQTFSICDLLLFLDTHALAPLRESWIHCWYSFFTLGMWWSVLTSKILFFWGGSGTHQIEKWSLNFGLQARDLRNLEDRHEKTEVMGPTIIESKFSNQLKIFTFLMLAICVIFNHTLSEVVLTKTTSWIERSLRRWRVNTFCYLTPSFGILSTTWTLTRFMEN